ncbi:hypothetical protein LguiB_009616 [Lonicera macranthoides]
MRERERQRERSRELKLKDFDVPLLISKGAFGTRMSFSVKPDPLPFYAMAMKDYESCFLKKYQKRKRGDEINTYCRGNLEIQSESVDSWKVLELDKPEYGACRNVLRAGPAGSLRVNIRAVAQYASESDSDNSATDNVDQCLRALEELDSLLLNASRNDPQASVKSTMKSKIGIAIDALDKLLKTVPSEVLDKGQAIADAYLNNEEEGGDLAPQNLDPELKQLESVL